MPQVKLVRKIEFISGVQYFQGENGALYRASLKRGELKELNRLRAQDPYLTTRYKDDPIGLAMLLKRSRAH